MNTKKGCKFCTRHGLPLLPVRPAVMSQDDVLPQLPSTLTPPLAAQGETAWTARLLREGFLYIWAESGQYWKSYFATADGYYYPLPEHGDVPPDIVSGKVKPCISEPTELAAASLVTLPVKPLGMKNGLFWFSWSEVAWTDAVRKQHEDAAYRSQYMQRFDMDAWVTSGKAEQALPISGLSDIVAEYSAKAGSCKIKKWCPSPWKNATPIAGENIRLAADSLYAGKGAILLLQDPPAILQELSALIDYDLQDQVYNNPLYKRELALASAISGLKEAMMRQFERDYIEKSESEERVVLHGPFGYSANSDLPDNMYTPLADRNMNSTVAKKWAEYEQYYEPDKMAAFQQKFSQALVQYNERIVSLRTGMYLEWIKSEGLLKYFRHNFDTAELSSGIAYVQTINYCITGMQDKTGVIRHFTDLLSGLPTDPNNILARTLVLNQDVLAEKLTKSVEGFSDWVTIPWSGAADAFNIGLANYREGALGAVSTAVGMLSGVVTRLVIHSMESKQVFACLVAMGVLTNKAYVTLEKTGTYKHFVTEVVAQLAKESGLAGRSNSDKLRHHVRQELRRLRVSGLPMEGVEVKRFLVMVDINKVHALQALPPKERAAELAKLLRLSADVEAQQFSQWQGAVRRGVSRVGDAMPFAIGVFSAVLQVAALWTTADLKNKKTLTADQSEAHAKFWAGVVGLTSASLGIVETGIKQFNLFASASSRFRLLRAPMVQKLIFGIGGRLLGVGAGIVAVGYDIYHMVDERNKGHIGLAIAYGLSALSGSWLIAALWFNSLPVLGTIIAVIFLIGTAIYLAINSRDKIQKWLIQCLWRRIPAKEGATEENKKLYQKREAADLPIWPDMDIEMNELKLAIGAGD
ncbi:hypothetical protein GW590_07040 [Rahnella sp. SAP-1]|uniref:Toxin VasX N-terminal region domain-containing protein n=1 Tax=Rouxiella aceris TaxID=2703884 RepID=A0A848MG10_9GAMM|nr:T6SS effector BTH_I2691 family protein [Rouxiella aceris]NMP26615.1 hypothetical protein [Rouxiella aceris]